MSEAFADALNSRPQICRCVVASSGGRSTRRAAVGAGKREPTTRPKATGAFVGREREIQAIDAAFEEAHGGRPRFVLLLGEPGIGKTRLAMEASGLFRKAGASVVWRRDT